MATVAAVIVHLGLLFIADHRTSHQWIIDPMTTTHAAGLTWTDTHSSTFSPNVFGVSGAFGPADLTQSNTALLEPSYWATLGQGDPQWSGPGVLPTNFGSGPAEVPYLTRELVILDRGVPQWEQLRDDFLAQRSGGRAIDVVVLEAGGDGIRQISLALAGYRNLQSLHIFSHGRAGALQLGGEWLHGGNLSVYAGDLLGWGDALAEGADVLLYGCDVAAGGRGQQFVDGLAALVGADVAASSDLTGHSSLGGNWTFEYVVGQVESSLALSTGAMQEWAGLLSQTIHIDNNWLLANGGGNGPYYLDQAGATYILQTDVSTPGTAFAIIAQNITFDLNGYTITYDNAAPITVFNGSFEQGDGALATGWDFSNAPNATRHAGVYLRNEVYDGDHSIRFGNTTSSQFVVSTQSITLLANTTYSLSAMFEYGGQGTTNNPGVKGYVQLVGDTTREVFFEGTNWRGIQFREGTFTTGNSAETYIVRVGVEGHSSANSSFFIDDIKIQRTQVYGVFGGPVSWANSTYNDIARFGNAANAVVKNGSISQGSGGATWAHAVMIHNANNSHFDELNIVVHGANTSAVFGFQQGPYRATVSRNSIQSHVKTITSRDNNHGTVIIGVHGTISGNLIDGGPLSGIITGSNQGTPDGQVFNNIVRIKASNYTNAFAIIGSNGTDIYDNVIETHIGEYSGRGLRANGTSNKTANVYGNVIRVRTLATNQEYEGVPLGGSYGVQLEGSGFVNFYNNEVFAYSAGVEAHAFRANSLTSQIHVHNNRFYAFSDGNQVASLIKLADIGENDILFEDNELHTNYGIIGGTLESTIRVFRSKLFYEAGGASNPILFEVGYSSVTQLHSLIEFVDLEFDSNAARTYFENAVPRNELRYGGTTSNRMSITSSWTTTLRLHNQHGNGIPNADFTVLNSLDEVVLQGVTDANGQYVGVVRQFQTIGTTKQDDNDHKFRVVINGQTSEQVFVADRVSTVTLVVTTDENGEPTFVYDNNRVIVTANGLDNTFTWSALDPLNLLIDGISYLINPGITEFVFHGLAGVDRLNLTGSSANDHFVLGVGNATLTTGTGLILRAFGFEEVFAAAGGGTLNQVFLSDSAGDDHFAAWAGLATMIGSGFHHQVTGFQRVTANRSTGNDAATLYDSAGDDVFLSHVAFSSMTGSGFVSRANGFATVVAHATNGGFNQAFLHDSNGDDLFSVAPTVASMTGPGFSHQAHGFQRVTANRSGGHDVAHFYGSAGNDILLSRRDFTSLTAGTFIGRANAFDTVVTFGGQGGHDQAFMHDTPGADLFTATLGVATMTGTGYHHEVRDFHRVMAFRSSGNDAAHFHGSAFNDTFLTYPEFASMISGSFVNRADGFTSVVGFGGAAGFDQAFMYDSAGDDLFSATDGLATMTGPGFQHESRGFQRVTAHRTTGNDVAHFFDSPGDDTFLTRREFSSLISATGTNRANWFPTVVAFGGAGGVDTARFYSSADSDTFRGGFADLTMSGSGYSTRTESFGRVHLHGIPGGVVDDFRLDLDGATEVTLRPQLGVFRRGTQLIEALDFAQMTVRRVGTAVSAEAQLWAGAGDDVFEGRADFALMSGSGYQNRAENFAATTGRAGGVNNAAYLYGGSQDNHLVGDLLVPRLWGAGYSHTLRDFRQIFVQAGVGGQNRLNLGDSPGDDVVTVGAGWAQLVGSGVTLEAQGFTNQIVRSERGGADTVYLLSTGSSNLAGMYENFTWLTNLSNSYYLRANNFANVEVQQMGGGSDNRVNVFAPVGGTAQALSFADNFGQIDHSTFRRRFSGFDRAMVQYRAAVDDVDNQGTDYRLSLVDLG